MRLSEKYGRWGIVCGGTIVQGSTQQSPCLGRRECLCRWIVYRGEVTPCNRVSSQGLSVCKKTLYINFSHSVPYPKEQILHWNQHIECLTRISDQGHL
jgi:hypothetical protein